MTREIAKSLCERLRQTNKNIITLFGALVHEVEEEMNLGR